MRFIAEGADRTRVELEDRRLERYADKAADMRRAIVVRISEADQEDDTAALTLS